MTTDDEIRAVEKVVERLRAKFISIPQQRVTEVVDAAYHEFDGAPIRDFVPIMVERMSADRLSAA